MEKMAFNTKVFCPFVLRSVRLFGVFLFLIDVVVFLHTIFVLELQVSGTYLYLTENTF